MKNCIGIINLDENENRMGELVVNRSISFSTNSRKI